MALDLSFKPFSGVGAVHFFERGAGGVLLGGFDLGEAPTFTIGKTAPSVEMNTTRNVSRGVAYRMAQSKSANLNIELQTLSDFNLQLLTSGSWTEAIAGSAVVGWVAPTNLVVGQVIKLPAHNVSAVAVKDSTGSPKTVPPASYEVDPMAGTIVLKDITTGGPYVQPFKVDYTPGAIKTLGALKVADKEYTVQFNGINAYDSERVIVEVFRFRFAAEGDMALKSTEFGTYQLAGSILQDETRSEASAGGQYYRLVKAGA